MKKILVLSAILSTFILYGCNNNVSQPNQELSQNILLENKENKEIKDYDSSSWPVRPETYGMTAKEYIRTESLSFFKTFVDRAGINNFSHFKGLSKAEDKWVVSPNNDTVYSIAVVNTEEGFTLTIPEIDDRFLSIQIIDENHFTPYYLYGGGTYEFSSEDFSTKYVAVGIRTGTNATEEDIKHIIDVLQPQYQINNAKDGWDIENLDFDTMVDIREQLIPYYELLPSTAGCMVKERNLVTDEWKFVLATAGAWGLSANENAMYAIYAPNLKADKVYSATYTQPEVDAFWSITIYDEDKYLISNEHNIINSSNVKLNEDGTFTVYFVPKGMTFEGENVLWVEDNWNFLMRAYRPNVESFNNYQMPNLTPVD